MKVAVTSMGPSLDDQVEARFGRCPYFLIIDPETMEFEALENPNIAVGGGAGIQSAQLMAERGIQIVLTGNCGPNAFQTFGAAGVQVIVGVSGPVRQAVEQFKAGAFTEAGQASVESHFGVGAGAPGYQTVPPQSGYGAGMGGGRGTGMGRGMGMGGGQGTGMGRGMGMGGGRGMGMGQGMGGGRGMGMGQGMGGGQGARFANVSGSPMSQPPMAPEEELTTLEEQARILQKQLQDIERRLSQIQKK
ncbi:MAG: NifB/NifX family molybdenum-iron cluster-binding protein [Thermodesulfobacteriota bacterium]|nr:NifB/NifX family molybdenum-iron cluster-binding protein [Thermodesulfobacteriota bacterium]